MEPNAQCKQCPQGYFNTKKGSSSCTPCSYFQYQSELGQYMHGWWLLCTVVFVNFQIYMYENSYLHYVAMWRGKDGIPPLGFFLRRHFSIVLHSIYVTLSLTTLYESPVVQMSMSYQGFLLSAPNPQFFLFVQLNLLVIRNIWAQTFLNLLESSIFCALSKSRLKCCTTEF